MPALKGRPKLISRYAAPCAESPWLSNKSADKYATRASPGTENAGWIV